MTDRDRALTAFHEAGHCVVGVVLGLPVMDASVEPNDETLGRVRLGNIHETQRRSWVLMVAAGPESVIRVTGGTSRCVPPGVEDDRRQLRDYFERQVAEERQRFKAIVGSLEERIRHCLRKSANLVDVNWPSIDAVSKELYLRQTLTANEVRQLLKPARKAHT